MIYRKLDVSEHDIQSTYFRWVRITAKMHPVLNLAFAVPNAGKRGYKTAAMLIAEGLRKGVPDIMFPVARKGFKGFAIEFKKPAKDGVAGGKLSDEQVAYIDQLVQEGWLVSVLTDALEAIKVTKAYLDI